MAECLTWKDLSEDTLMTILTPEDTSLIRRNVRDAFRIQDDGEERGEILVDLYYNTIIFAQEKRLTMEKTSTLVSIVKVIHEQSTVGRMPMDKSWEKTKQILMVHSVQRPPFSVAIFSMADLQAITHYLLHTIETLDTSNFVELAPYVPELRTFATQDEYDEEQEQIRKAQEDELARIAELAMIAAEEERKRQIEAAYLAAIPDEITQKVIDVLTQHLYTMKKELNEQIHVTEDKVVNKIVEIDSRILPPKPGSIRGSLKGGSILKSGSVLKAGSIRGSLKK